MKIQRLFVSNFKNLVDCEITPSGIHAITGCNSMGKSNFMEVLLLISDFLSGSEEKREEIINLFIYNDSSWIPYFGDENIANSFKFSLSTHIRESDKKWQIDYQLEISFANGNISYEHVALKQLGKTGKARTLLLRENDGTTNIFFERDRKKEKYKTKSDMSALQSLEVRQADDFSKKFPVTSIFLKELKSSRMVRIDPESFIKKIMLKAIISEPQRHGRIVQTYDPFELIQEIKSDDARWKQFLFWLREIAGIENIELIDTKTSKEKYILIYQHGRFLFYGEISMGTAVTIGILIALFSSLNTGGVVLMEEPENHLHPHAIIKLIELFREFTDRQNLLLSTHSPVVLNALNPEEVTVMKNLENGFVTTQKVADIKEAIDALNRGFFSLGDLLETNFKNE